MFTKNEDLVITIPARVLDIIPSNDGMIKIRIGIAPDEHDFMMLEYEIDAATERTDIREAILERVSRTIVEVIDAATATIATIHEVDGIDLEQHDERDDSVLFAADECDACPDLNTCCNPCDDDDDDDLDGTTFEPGTTDHRVKIGKPSGVNLDGSTFVGYDDHRSEDDEPEPPEHSLVN